MSKTYTVNITRYKVKTKINYVSVNEWWVREWSHSVVSSSLRPHGLQPTRLLHPWDSPGKNTGVGCHFLLQCMRVKSESEVAQSGPTSRPHGLQPTRLLHPWDFPGKSTGVGCHCLLQTENFDIFWIVSRVLQTH